jgi:D-alanyl-D-alanine carboxypeptidase (penicillin-binding protein 5/6)
MHLRKKKLYLPLIIINLFINNALWAQNLAIPSPPIIGAKSYLVIDSTTDFEIAALDPDLRLPPASITKLMTAYAVFHALKNNQISLEDEVIVSEKAWRAEGSRMFIEVGKKVSVNNLLMGMIVQSGNDASIALAEHIAGSESLFSDLMNQYAYQLNMTNSSFRNASGLPDEDHYSTANDLAILAKAIIQEFPEYYQWYSTKEFTFNNIKQQNRNSLLWRDPSVDGMKTGSTNEAGYSLISSAKRDDMRIISVVLGTASSKARIDGSQAMINYGYRFYETKTLLKANQEIISTKTWKTEKESISLGIEDDIRMTLPRGNFNNIKIEKDIPNQIIGAIKEGQRIGNIEIKLNDNTLNTISLIALEDNPRGSFWKQIKDTIQLWFE